jgi:hypothetical protein
MASKFDSFLASLRSDATRVSYRSNIRAVLGADPDAFLSMPPEEAKALLVDYIVKNRDRVTGATLANKVLDVKAFCDEYSKQLDWKVIRRKVPVARYVGVDRAPTAEEVRGMLKGVDRRTRFVVLVMASSGIRVGAFDWLQVKDLAVLGSGLGLLTVYRGEPEEYPAFVTPEAVAAWEDYRRERERVGEKIVPGSPLVRDKWDYAGVRYDRQRVAPDIARPLKAAALKHIVERAWMRSGLKSPAKGGGVKACHGFRKFAKTQLSQAGLKWEDTEALLGHRMPYYKPTVEHLEGEYLKAVPLLTMSEAEEAKMELAEKEEEWGRESRDLKLELLLQKEMNREYGVRIAALEEQMRSLLPEQAPAAAQPAPRSRPQAGA